MRGLTVVIPSRNIANLRVCVEAIREKDPSVSIVVIDDGLKARAPAGVTILSGAEPFCFSRNVNLGIAAVAEDAADVILLNDDAVLLTPGGFTEMHAVALAHPELGIISPAVIGPSCSPDHGPHVPAGLRQIRGRMVPFVCVLIRRIVIDAVGPLDERFEGVYGGEDHDYCYRVRQAGLRIGIFDGCIVDHSKLQSTFRPNGPGPSIATAIQRFFDIHGFQMGSR